MAGGRIAASGRSDGGIVNQGSAGAVSSTGGDRLVASDNPAGDSDGGLTPDYYQYECANASALLSPGNGRFYRVAPNVTSTLGSVTKSYDGTATAPLDDGNTTVAGLISSDDWTLDGTYADKNVGTGIAVTVVEKLAKPLELSQGGF